MTAALGSERFKLASKWFHCVRLGEEVRNEGHPYHALVKGKNPARLVLVSRDGSKLTRLLGTAEHKVSWEKIRSVLRKDYKKDPTNAVKAIERLLSKFDALDNKRKELRSLRDRAAKSNRKDRIKLVEKKLAANEKERQTLLAKKAKLAELGLRKPD